MTQISDNDKLDDPSRVVEIVSAEGVIWETSGNANDAGGWLGTSATERDRKAIRDLAKRMAPDRAVRVSFPSVMTFVLGYDPLRGRWGIYVPESES